jgi:hypothetical protein
MRPRWQPARAPAPQSDISDIYMLPAATRGVFVNIALQVRQGRGKGVGLAGHQGGLQQPDA